MPRTVAALAGIAAIVGGLAALSTTSTGASASPRQAQKDAERRTEQRTERFLRAFERRDLRAVASMLDPKVRLVHPITFSGAQEPEAVFEGKSSVVGYFRGVFAGMGRIAFSDERVSVVAGGRASFVQANGDFTTADGRPYDNVYAFRFDWRDGRIVRGEEYFNPVTFSRTFGRPLG
jgi:ketosteroid isomerase-like protein